MEKVVVFVVVVAAEGVEVRDSSFQWRVCGLTGLSLKKSNPWKDLRTQWLLRQARKTMQPGCLHVAGPCTTRALLGVRNSEPPVTPWINVNRSEIRRANHFFAASITSSFQEEIH